MKVPKYIEKALKQRAMAADRWNSADFIISKYIDKHRIAVEDCDYHGGCEAIVNPWDSSERVLEAIKNHKEIL